MPDKTAHTGELTAEELKAALARTSAALGHAAVRDYDERGPYYESAGTRAILKRWQALEAERVRRL